MLARLHAAPAPGVKGLRRGVLRTRGLRHAVASRPRGPAAGGVMRFGFFAVGVALALGAPLRAAGVEERPLKIGLAAMISPKETLAYYNRVLARVGQKLGRRVEMVQYRTYDEMDVALERRELEIAFICAGPYVNDKE